jgi:hypothetical protein
MSDEFNEDQAVDVKDILVADINPMSGENQDIGEFEGQGDWGVFVNQEPTRPANCITIYNSPTSTIPQPAVNKPGRECEFSQPTVQIRVRSTDNRSGMAKIWECYNALQNRGPYQTSLYRYSAFYCQNAPFWLSEDNDNRQIFVLNVQCSRAYFPETEGSPS